MSAGELNVSGKLNITIKADSPTARAGNIDIRPPYARVIIADAKHMEATASIRAIQIETSRISSGNNIELPAIELSTLDDWRSNGCGVDVG